MWSHWAASHADIRNLGSVCVVSSQPWRCSHKTTSFHRSCTFLWTSVLDSCSPPMDMGFPSVGTEVLYVRYVLQEEDKAAAVCQDVSISAQSRVTSWQTVCFLPPRTHYIWNSTDRAVIFPPNLFQHLSSILQLMIESWFIWPTFERTSFSACVGGTYRSNPYLDYLANYTYISAPDEIRSQKFLKLGSCVIIFEEHPRTSGNFKTRIQYGGWRPLWWAASAIAQRCWTTIEKRQNKSRADPKCDLDYSTKKVHTIQSPSFHS